MSAHTPGPWVLAEAVENRFQKTDMRRVRAAHESFEHGAVCEVYGIRDGSVAGCNARLIVMAPELLAALIGMIESYETEASSENPALIAAKSVVARATGGAA